MISGLPYSLACEQNHRLRPLLLLCLKIWCCNWLPTPGPLEVNDAGKVADWLVEGLQPLLSENVVANLQKLVLTGHSRGVKTAFAVALGHSYTKLKFSVLVSLTLWLVAVCSAEHALVSLPMSLNPSIYQFQLP